MGNQKIDLGSLFSQVTKAMVQNKASLNEADTYNHDHGDHMVEIFDVISQAMKEKESAEPADQLEYAAQLLRRKSNSGSGKMYASGLDQAAKQVLGKNLDAGAVVSMMQTILGGGQPPAAKAAPAAQSVGSGDLLGSLLGSLTGGQGGGQSTTEQANGSGDFLGSLLGSLTGAQGGSGEQGLDMGDLLGAGMSYMAAKQSGKSDLEALTGALVSGSQVANSSPHRAQSTEIVTSTLLSALTSMMAK